MVFIWTGKLEAFKIEDDHYTFIDFPHNLSGQQQENTLNATTVENMVFYPHSAGPGICLPTLKCCGSGPDKKYTNWTPPAARPPGLYLPAGRIFIRYSVRYPIIYRAGPHGSRLFLPRTTIPYGKGQNSKEINKKKNWPIFWKTEQFGNRYDNQHRQQQQRQHVDAWCCHHI